MDDDRSMNHLWAAALACALLGCEGSNPRSCTDGSCTDPAYPFCDFDGALEGSPEVCIAVECTPGELRACRGDAAITCNAAGGDYDLVQCEKGCDEASGGCRLCEPNQIACTNGKVAMCDSAGKATVTETCALGCFGDQPRCRVLLPSNNLGQYADMVQSPPNVELSNAEFSTETGTVMAGGQPVDVPSFLVPASGNGVEIRVFVVNTLKLTSATIGGPAQATEQVRPAIAFVAAGDVSLEGELVVSTLVGGARLGCRPAGAGAWTTTYASGGGGGGNASAGADGGAITGAALGGVGDTSSGTALIVPLRGGCSGGNPGQTAPISPNGGGAIQVSSGGALRIDATIDVRGGDGTFWTDQAKPYACSGGGSGGSILLEGATVELGPNAKLLGGGGNGFTVCPSANCGAAGNGATATTAATKGGDAPNASNATAGGGGGGLGRVRVNTADGVYTKASSVVEDAVVSTGTVQTR